LPHETPVGRLTTCAHARHPWFSMAPTAPVDITTASFIASSRSIKTSRTRIWERIRMAEAYLARKRRHADPATFVKARGFMTDLLVRSLTPSSLRADAKRSCG
jgi:hypothetical protein